MKTPNLKEVQEHFKDAKEIQCGQEIVLMDDIIDVKPSGSRYLGIRKSQFGVALWSPIDGYSKIVSVKSNYMKMLNEEQKDYLKTLESHKKRRIFVVDCIIENSIRETTNSTKISDLLSPEYVNIEEFLRILSSKTHEGFSIKYGIQDEAPSINRNTLRDLWESAIPKNTSNNSENKDDVLKFDMLKETPNYDSGLYKELCVYFSKTKGIRLNYVDAQFLEKIVLKYHETANSEKKDELLKFDMLEEDVKCDVCGMSPKIENSNKCVSCDAFVKHTVATSDIFKNLRNDETANSEKKYTEEDMRKAFIGGRTTLPKKAQGLAAGIFSNKDVSMNEWFEQFKKMKNE